MNLKEQALREYANPETTAHHGGAFGRPFWNVQSSQFMYAPAFQFTIAPGAKTYIFTAKDESGKTYTFEADSPMALLTPIWSDIPEGFVELTVHAEFDMDLPRMLMGARTFYKCAPYPGPEAFPPKARSYKETARKALDYAFSQSYIQYWLTHGTPDPEYDFNVYPSKTYSSVIQGMLDYAKVSPKNKDAALKIAENVADFMISISFSDDTPLHNIPPTYYVDFRKDLSKYNNESAIVRGHGVMMIYPASAGLAYLALEKATGKKRYFEAAEKIADYYKNNVLENGSWYLFLDAKTGEPISPNYCVPNVIMTFMHEMYERTGEDVFKTLEENAWNYMVKKCLEPYDFEGQFEDSAISTLYSNLAHGPACFMLEYILNNKKDDPALMGEADDLLRFIEDQFVVWGKHAKWDHHPNPKQGGNKEEWYTPAGLEQFRWLMPIDASTSNIMMSFIQMYQLKKDPLMLAKACTLGDMLTRMQNPENGFIPTQWMRKSCIEDEKYFWINCLFSTAKRLIQLSELTEESDADTRINA